MHEGKKAATMMAIRKLAGVASEVNRNECTLNMALARNPQQGHCSSGSRGGAGQGGHGPDL